MNWQSKNKYLVTIVSKSCYWGTSIEEQVFGESAAKSNFSGNQLPKVIFRGINCQKGTLKVLTDNLKASRMWINVKTWKIFSIFVSSSWPYQIFSKFFPKNLPHWKILIFWYVVQNSLKMIPIQSDQRWRTFFLKKN